MYLYYIFLVFIFLLAIKLYVLLTTGKCTSRVCLNGKTCIITGSNTGIGYYTALEFAKRGAKVILACRNIETATAAQKKIISLTENDKVIVRQINMNSLSSIREFSALIHKTEDKIDILVNNAGIGAVKDKKTEDGLQILMQINYFGPVLLTILLLDLLKKSEKARIINVSSCLAKTANLSVDNINKFPNSSLKNYSNSKLGNILFTIKLAELLKGSNVTTYSVHPGVVSTNIFNNVKKSTIIGKIILGLLMPSYFKSPEEGAQTTLHTALEQNLEPYSGEHFTECVRVARYSKAIDSVLTEKLFQETIKLTKCENEVRDLFPLVKFE